MQKWLLRCFINQRWKYCDRNLCAFSQKEKVNFQSQEKYLFCRIQRNERLSKCQSTYWALTTIAGYFQVSECSRIVELKDLYLLSNHRTICLFVAPKIELCGNWLESNRFQWTSPTRSPAICEILGDLISKYKVTFGYEINGNTFVFNLMTRHCIAPVLGGIRIFLIKGKLSFASDSLVKMVLPHLKVLIIFKFFIYYYNHNDSQETFCWYRSTWNCFRSYISFDYEFPFTFLDGPDLSERSFWLKLIINMI